MGEAEPAQFLGGAYVEAYLAWPGCPPHGATMTGIRAVVDKIWPLAYTAGHDAHLTEWARNLAAGIDDEETLKARRLALARRLVAPEIRDATRDQHVGERLEAWLREAEGGG